MSPDNALHRIRHHIANLASPEDTVAQRAKRFLHRYYGARTLPQLLEACHDENPQVRYHVAYLPPRPAPAPFTALDTPVGASFRR